MFPDLSNDPKYQQGRATELEKFAASGHPYVEFVAVRNKGKHDQCHEPLFFDLESSNGTEAAVLGLERKGFLVVGCGNIRVPVTPEGVTTLSEMGGEHLRIKHYVEGKLRERQFGFEMARQQAAAAAAQQQSPERAKRGAA